MRLRLESRTVGVIAETRIRDLQSLLRREHRKQVDSETDLLLLVVSRTRANVDALAIAAEVLGTEFPLRTRAVLTAISRGVAPKDNGIVML